MQQKLTPKKDFNTKILLRNYIIFLFIITILTRLSESQPVGTWAQSQHFQTVKKACRADDVSGSLYFGSTQGMNNDGDFNFFISPTVPMTGVDRYDVCINGMYPSSVSTNTAINFRLSITKSTDSLFVLNIKTQSALSSPFDYFHVHAIFATLPISSYFYDTRTQQFNFTNQMSFFMNADRSQTTPALSVPWDIDTAPTNTLHARLFIKGIHIQRAGSQTRLKSPGRTVSWNGANIQVEYQYSSGYEGLISYIDQTFLLLNIASNDSFPLHIASDTYTITINGNSGTFPTNFGIKSVYLQPVGKCLMGFNKMNIASTVNANFYFTRSATDQWQLVNINNINIVTFLIVCIAEFKCDDPAAIAYTPGYDFQNFACFDCNSDCQTCVAQDTCSECILNTSIIVSGLCKTCLQTYGANCTQCDNVTCTECTGTTLNMTFKAGSCQTCSFFYQSTCLDCDETTCLICNQTSLNMTISSGICQTCQHLYQISCQDCDQTICLQCFYNSTFQNGICQSCAHLFSSSCLQCNNSTCVLCDQSSANMTIISNNCQLCTTLYGATCFDCNTNNCSHCDQSSQNMTIINDACLPCSALFTANCLDCSASTCLLCDQSTTNMTIINGSCFQCSELYCSLCVDCDASICLQCPGNTTTVVTSNGSCVQCSVEYGAGCLNCDVLTCLACDQTLVNMTIINGSCQNCASLFNVDCLSCDSSSCLICDQTLTNMVIINGSCYSCNSLYQPQCQQCDTSTCLLCDQSTSNMTIVNGSCYACPFLYQTECLQCSSTTCLQCQQTLSNMTIINGSCYSCPSLYSTDCLQCSLTTCLSCNQTLSNMTILPTNGSCVECNLLYTGQCIQCDPTTCVQCDESISNKVVVNQSCHSCDLLYTGGCIDCDIGTCLQCNQTAGNTTIINTTCFACDSLYNSECVQCDSFSCLECNQTVANMTIISGSCYTCQTIFTGGCLECTDTTCLLCDQSIKNKTIINGSCYACKQLYSSNSSQCLQCDPTTCLQCDQSTQNATIINTQCYACNNIYSGGCLQCSNTTCLQCDQSTQNKTIITAQCYACNNIYSGGCIQCDPTTCLLCDQSTVNKSIINGSCVQCKVQYLSSCLECDASTCLLCDQVTAGSNMTIVNLTCHLCSDLYLSCLDCDATTCLVCDQSLSGKNMTIINGSCYLCDSLYMGTSECLQCDPITCLQCNETIFNTTIINSSCHTCPSLYQSQCLQCQQTTCLLCDESTNNMTIVNGSCYFCNSLYRIPCLYCDSLACLMCDQSVENMTVVENGSCYSCAELYGGLCLDCNSTVCLECQSTVLNETRSFIDGNCQLCENFYGQDCIDCDGMVCLECRASSGRFLNTTTNSCECMSGFFYVGFTCIDTLGCISGVLIVGGNGASGADLIKCLRCDTQSMLQPMPIESNFEYKCICKYGYEIGSTNQTSIICTPICADRILVNGQECDDGNLEDGDGCDSNCQLENTGDHTCYQAESPVDSLYSFTECVTEYTLEKTTLLYVKKDLFDNTAEMLIQLHPTLEEITDQRYFKMNSSDSSASNLKIYDSQQTIMEHTVKSYDPKSGQLLLQFQFDATTESSNIKLFLNLSLPYYESKLLSKTFRNIQGLNTELIFTDQQSFNHFQILYFVCIAIVLLVWILFITSCCVKSLNKGHLPLIGLETFQIVQFIYCLSIFGFQDTNQSQDSQIPLCLSIFAQSLRYINGISIYDISAFDWLPFQIVSKQQIYTLPQVLTIMGYGKELSFNCFLFLLISIIGVIVCIKCYVRFKTTESIFFQYTDVQENQLNKVNKMTYQKKPQYTKNMESIFSAQNKNQGNWNFPEVKNYIKSKNQFQFVYYQLFAPFWVMSLWHICISLSIQMSDYQNLNDYFSVPAIVNIVSSLIGFSIPILVIFFAVINAMDNIQRTWNLSRIEMLELKFQINPKYETIFLFQYISGILFLTLFFNHQNGSTLIMLFGLGFIQIVKILYVFMTKSGPYLTLSIHNISITLNQTIKLGFVIYLIVHKYIGNSLSHQLQIFIGYLFACAIIVCIILGFLRIYREKKMNFSQFLQDLKLQELENRQQPTQFEETQYIPQKKEKIKSKRSQNPFLYENQLRFQQELQKKGLAHEFWKHLPKTSLVTKEDPQQLKLLKSNLRKQLKELKKAGKK